MKIWLIFRRRYCHIMWQRSVEEYRVCLAYLLPVFLLQVYRQCQRIWTHCLEWSTMTSSNHSKGNFLIAQITKAEHTLYTCLSHCQLSKSKFKGFCGSLLAYFYILLSTFRSYLLVLLWNICWSFHFVFSFDFSYTKATEKQASNIMKCTVVILGIIVTGLVFVAERMGSIFQMGVSLSSLASGAYLGIFTLGMISRRTNAKVSRTLSGSSELRANWIEFHPNRELSLVR